MKYLTRFFGLLLCALALHCSGESNKEVVEEPAEVESSELVLPTGFEAKVFADRLGTGRHLTVRRNGDVYVALRTLENGSGIVALRDTDKDGEADLVERFGQYPGTGIEARDEYLYFASDLAVYRYRFENDELVPKQPPETIVEGFPEQGSHAVKPFTFDDSGGIYVNVGAPSNACQEKSRTPGNAGLDPCPQLERQAGIWRFRADVVGQNQLEHGQHFGRGIRNAVAISWNPAVGHLYALQHGRDQLHHLWPDLYSSEQSAELPAEEFLLVEEGADFGWPYCYYDQLQEKRVLAPEYGGDGLQEDRCRQFESPILAFPGHWAPNDLVFYDGTQFPARYRDGAFIAFHGSWNRSPEVQAGYLVAFVPFEGKLPSAGWEIFADGFAGVDEVISPRDAVYRPTGVAVGPDGSLYISDSREGRIWQVNYHAE